MKNKILTISIIFISLFFLFINNNVFAVETNKLIVDGYDMSDIYNYYSPDDAFFIYKLSGESLYRFYKPKYNSDYSYNAIHSGENVIAYYDVDWWASVGRSRFLSF